MPTIAYPLEHTLKPKRAERRPLVLVFATIATIWGCDPIQNGPNPRRGLAAVIQTTIVEIPGLNLPGYFEGDATVIARVSIANMSPALAGARVSLSISAPVLVSTPTIALSEVSRGNFSVSSLQAEQLVYLEGAGYLITIQESGGKVHQARITAPKRVTTSSVTSNPEGDPVSPELPYFRTHPRTQNLVLSWPRETGGYPAVIVYRTDIADSNAVSMVYELPSLSYPVAVANLESMGPVTRTTIPSSVFAEAGVYAVVLVTLDLAKSQEASGSNNVIVWQLFAGSGAPLFLSVE